VAEFAARRVELEAADQAKLVDAQARGEKLSGLTVKIAQKAGVDGKLFGSVTNADIAAALEAQGFKIEKSQVRLPEGHLKQIGDHPISITLHADVVANITVSVLGE
jgi:large subunit ribosomal protein L9